MKIDEFDYELPKELIAQKPSEKRDVCRMMVLDRQAETIEHKHFYDCIDYLNPGAVSYTHLDVYKRQVAGYRSSRCRRI